MADEPATKPIAGILPEQVREMTENFKAAIDPLAEALKKNTHDIAELGNKHGESAHAIEALTESHSQSTRAIGELRGAHDEHDAAIRGLDRKHADNAGAIGKVDERLAEVEKNLAGPPLTPEEIGRIMGEVLGKPAE